MCAIVFVCVLFICLCIKHRMMKIMYIDLNHCYEINHSNFFRGVKMHRYGVFRVKFNAIQFQINSIYFCNFFHNITSMRKYNDYK